MTRKRRRRPQAAQCHQGRQPLSLTPTESQRAEHCAHAHLGLGTPSEPRVDINIGDGEPAVPGGPSLLERPGLSTVAVWPGADSDAGAAAAGRGPRPQAPEVNEHDRRNQIH